MRCVRRVSRPDVADLGDKDRDARHSGLGKGWTVAPKEIPPIVFGSEPPDHKGGDPFLVGALGSQNGSGAPSRQTRIEHLGNTGALEGPTEQDAHEPYETWGVPESDPLPVSLGPLDPFPDHVLVATLADPHALVSKKGVGIAFGVPPVLVDADETILGKVPKDIGPGAPEAERKAPGEAAVVLDKCGPPSNDGVAVRTN